MKWEDGSEVRDLDQVGLESEPYRRLSCSWHTYQPECSEMFGWTEEQFAALVKGWTEEQFAALVKEKPPR